MSKNLKKNDCLIIIFRIWHAGMVEVGEEFIQVILNTTAMKYTFAILILIPILSRSYSTNIAFKTVAAFLPIILFFGLKTLSMIKNL